MVARLNAAAPFRERGQISIQKHVDYVYMP